MKMGLDPLLSELNDICTEFGCMGGENRNQFVRNSLKKLEMYEGLRSTFQSRVARWVKTCFGGAVATDRLERGDRLLEEVFELLQSGDYPVERVAALRDYVWARAKGEPYQEVGGVMVTLASYCWAHGLNMHGAGQNELDRVWGKIDAIRAKQASKPVGSALPVAQPEKCVEVKPGYSVDAWTFETSPVPLSEALTARTVEDVQRETLGGWSSLHAAQRVAYRAGHYQAECSLEEPESIEVAVTKWKEDVRREAVEEYKRELDRLNGIKTIDTPAATRETQPLTAEQFMDMTRPMPDHPYDEQYDCQSDVERDPYGAWVAIQHMSYHLTVEPRQTEIDRLRAAIDKIADMKPHHAGQTGNEYHMQRIAREARKGGDNGSSSQDR